MSKLYGGGMSSKLVISRRSLLATAVAAPFVLTGTRAFADVTSASAAVGADRERLLLEAAKKEEGLSIYVSMPVRDALAVTEAFEKKYGIKVKSWRGTSEDVMKRVDQEFKDGKADVDLVETNGPELETLARVGALLPVSSPAHDSLVDGAVTSHKRWVGTRLNIYAFLYNTNLVKKDELPKAWDELARPRWRGRLAVEADIVDWFATIVTELGEERGIRILRDIAQRNGLSARRGHTTLTNLVVRGEVPMAMSVYDYQGQQQKKEGAPVDLFYLPPTPARLNGIGGYARSKSPYSATLFYDFMLTDGQKILDDRGFTPTSKALFKIEDGVKVSVINSAKVLDENEKWEKIWREQIVRQ
jgi:iron(III) transport system substrate-binding protein